MDPDMFISALEDYSEMDVQSFFDAQVFQPGFRLGLLTLHQL